MISTYVLNQVPLMATLSLLARAAEAENIGLRGNTATQIELESSDPSVVLPPPPSFPMVGLEDIIHDEDNEDSTRSRSKHGGNDGTMELSMSSTSAEPRIINGQNATIDEFEYYAYMLGFDDNGGMFGRGCGATLIEDEWILTAAHCNCEAGDIAYIGSLGASSSSPEKAYVAECFNHHKYTWPEYDYALCRLVEPSKMKKVRIADANYEPERNQALTVIGTGATSEGSGAILQLMKAEVPYVTKSDCARRFGSFRSDSMLCAGGGDTDACQGDSGGPLFYKENGEYVQIGIVSWGIGCGREGNPGVYSDIAEQRAWIDDTICKYSVNSVASMCRAPTDVSSLPSVVPSNVPSMLPSNKPSTVPSNKPSPQPENPSGGEPDNSLDGIFIVLPDFFFWSNDRSPGGEPSSSSSRSPSSSPSAMPSRSNCNDATGLQWFVGARKYCNEVTDSDCSVDFWKGRCPKSCNNC